MATAIYDGADGIMLSAESAAGKFPKESVEMQQKIITAVENDTVSLNGSGSGGDVRGAGGGRCFSLMYHLVAVVAPKLESTGTKRLKKIGRRGEAGRVDACVRVLVGPANRQYFYWGFDGDAELAY